MRIFLEPAQNVTVRRDYYCVKGGYHLGRFSGLESIVKLSGLRFCMFFVQKSCS